MVRLGGRGTRPANFTMNVCLRRMLVKKWGRQPAFFLLRVGVGILYLSSNIKAGHFAGIENSFCALGLVRWAKRSAKPKVQKPYPAKMRRLWHLVVLCSRKNHAKQVVRLARRRMRLWRGYPFVCFSRGGFLSQPVTAAGIGIGWKFCCGFVPADGRGWRCSDSCQWQVGEAGSQTSRFANAYLT